MDKLIKTKNCCIKVFTEEAEDLAIILDKMIDIKNYTAAEKLINDLSFSQMQKDRLLNCLRSYKNSC